MTHHHRGWKPNIVDFTHTFTGRHALSKSGTLLPNSDLSPFTPDVMDQGSGREGTNSCTGHAISDGSYTSFGKSGQPLPFVPSERLLYWGARAEERARLGIAPSTPVADIGAYPSDSMAFVAQVGLSPMGPLQGGRFSDVSVKNVNEEILLGEVEGSFKSESHAILRGPNIVGDTCAALSEYACPAGFFVDMAFENWDVARDGFVGAPTNPNDPNGGGHYIDLVGFAHAGLIASEPKIYLPTKIVHLISDQVIAAIAQHAAALPSNDPVFFAKNSWGSWGLFGFFLATKAWLTANRTGDVNAMLPVLK